MIRRLFRRESVIKVRTSRLVARWAIVIYLVEGQPSRLIQNMSIMFGRDEAAGLCQPPLLP